ncbi:DUF6682 family protein [Sulfitobacter sp. R18_1]|uniref:phage adaptor protein n=1 Tax=Sulfitobacter sp. R18_1 TaxID=2821104 RepID=UPI001ADA07F2|nr:DUF6682 family protein [Sulfitobacter sp. R18_1]MBO9430621.1 hypothetical protein [Sulfitobacter sp. R18_1]
MTFKSIDVLDSASITLQDASHVRWPQAELHGYLNDGLREIVTLKPNAVSKTVNLELEEGTLQTLPPEYTILSRVSRNMVDANTGGMAIRRLDSRSIMDSHIPGWQDPSKIPHSKTVVHVIHDIADPNVFYVAPGNDGTGMIEAVVGAYPTPSPGGSYNDDVDVPDIYKNPLVNYVLYRAYAKDARLAGSAARAQAHFELFRNSVTSFSQSENGMSLAAANSEG